jgi:3-hydroxybutyryl-CoA dehydrogenase
MTATGTPLDPATVVAVIGAGTMGSGIARVAAAAGHPVLLFDAVPGAVDRAIAAMASRLERSVAKGRTAPEELAAIMARVTGCDHLEQLAPAGLVVEAIVEDLAVKQEVLGRLEAVLGAGAILATNTSSLSVTAIAAGLDDPGRVVGMHFFNPAPVMSLVEVVHGTATRPEVAATAAATAAAWGKTPVDCSSTPGFIVNRVARPFYGEALRLLGEGVADAATIDAVVTGAGGFRMGPFALMDLVGLDVNLAVSKSVYTQTFHDPRFAPNVIQQSLVDAGRLGRKTGRGFFSYDGGEVAAPVTAAPGPAPGAVEVSGELGWAQGLVSRLEAGGVVVNRIEASGPGHVIIAGVHLVPTFGATATALAAGAVLGSAEVAVMDLVGDWESADRVAVAVADQAAPATGDVVAGLLQAAGYDVSVVDDVPGLILMRTVAQLASVAADAATLGVATPAAIDTAMRLGTNYPVGPITWANAIGATTIVTVLDILRGFYGEDRYRAAAALRRAAVGGRALGEETMP